RPILGGRRLRMQHAEGCSDDEDDYEGCLGQSMPPWSGTFAPRLFAIGARCPGDFDRDPCQGACRFAILSVLPQARSERRRQITAIALALAGAYVCTSWYKDRRYHVHQPENWECACCIGLHRSWVHDGRCVSRYRPARKEVSSSHRQGVSSAGAW